MNNGEQRQMWIFVLANRRLQPLGHVSNLLISNNLRFGLSSEKMPLRPKLRPKWKTSLIGSLFDQNAPL
jgi:hypothetical protein